MSEKKKAIVIYIGGFLVPEGRMPYPTDNIPDDIIVIPVYPSGVSSLHDRVMQIFYEIKGGTIHYGQKHSDFHGHAETGATFASGKYPEWDSTHPIHIFGHSFGGLTARVLHAYLSEGDRFANYTTDSSWIVSVNVCNSPLNGCLMVYSLGANLTLAPVVRWASNGCLIGWIVQIWEFLDSPYLRSLYDFKMAYWNLSRTLPGSLFKGVLALCGVCVHTNTDNSAYDMTVHSQLAWQRYLEPTLPGTFYTSTVGTTFSDVPDTLSYAAYSIPRYILRALPLRVAGVDSSRWLAQGYDGLLSVKTQEHPFLYEQEESPLGQEDFETSTSDDFLTLSPHSQVYASAKLCRKYHVTTDMEDLASHLPGEALSGSDSDKRGPKTQVWYIRHTRVDHLGASNREEAWLWSLRAIAVFHKCRSVMDPKIFVKKAGPRDRADMQVPLWEPCMRPTHIMSWQYRAVVTAVAAMSAITIGVQHSVATPLVLLVLVPAAALASFPSWSSDPLEAYCACCRLALSVYFLLSATAYLDYCSIWAALLLADALLCALGANSKLDYVMPITKSLLAIAVGTLSESAMLVAVTIALDAVTLIAKLGWTITLRHGRGDHSSSPLLWIIVWLGWLGSITVFFCALPYALVSKECITLFAAACAMFSAGPSQVALVLTGCVTLLQRLRDLSDAFQAHTICLWYQTVHAR